MKRACALVVAVTMVVGALPSVSWAAPTQQPGQVAGTVRDRAGSTVSGQTVRLRNTYTGEVVGSVQSGTDGTFLFGNIQPGAYVVEAPDAAGQVVAVSAALRVMPGQMSIGGVMLTLPARDMAGAMVGSGNFFASTRGLVVLAAAGGAATAGIVAYQNNKKPKSKSKD